MHAEGERTWRAAPDRTNRPRRPWPVSTLLGIAMLLSEASLAAVSQDLLESPWIQVFAAGPGLGEAKATSEFNCSLFPSSCRFLYTLETRAPDPPDPPHVDIDWQDANTGFHISYKKMHLPSDPKQWYTDIPNGLGQNNPPDENGKVSFSGALGLLTAGGTAPYYVPPSNPVPLKGLLDDLKDVFGLSSGLVENPTLASFTSSVEQLPDGSYRYSYEVTNGTGVPLTFDWSDAGLGGVLDVGEMITRSFDSFLLPLAVIGISRTRYEEDRFGTPVLREFAAPTSAIVPQQVPEPPVAVLALLGFLGLRAVTRRKRVRGRSIRRCPRGTRTGRCTPCPGGTTEGARHAHLRVRESLRCGVTRLPRA